MGIRKTKITALQRHINGMLERMDKVVSDLQPYWCSWLYQLCSLTAPGSMTPIVRLQPILCLCESSESHLTSYLAVNKGTMSQMKITLSSFERAIKILDKTSTPQATAYRWHMMSSGCIILRKSVMSWKLQNDLEVVKWINNVMIYRIKKSTGGKP